MFYIRGLAVGWFRDVAKNNDNQRNSNQAQGDKGRDIRGVFGRFENDTVQGLYDGLAGNYQTNRHIDSDQNQGQQGPQRFAPIQYH